MKDEPAYPQSYTDCDGDIRCEAGLTKLEHFALVAMGALLSNPSLPGWLRDTVNSNHTTALTVEDMAIKHATTLIKQLEEER